MDSGGRRLTEAQVNALRWMRDFPSESAEWGLNGKPTSKGHKYWNTMKLSGPRGSIVIPIDDWRALHGLFDGCATPDKIYSPNNEGLAALSQAKGEQT